MFNFNKEKLVQLRTARGISQEALAREIGVSQVFIVYMENGYKEPSIKVLRRLANYFNCSMDDFMK